MIMCEHDCIPICDFCTYCEHEAMQVNGKFERLGPLSCMLSMPEFELSGGIGYCQMFHCINAHREEEAALNS